VDRPTPISRRGSPFATQLRPQLPGPFLLVVSVTLLVLFLLAVPVAERGPQVALPTAAETIPLDPTLATVLTVDQADMYVLDGRRVSAGDLPGLLESMAKAPRRPTLVVRGDATLPYRKIREVVQLAHQAGIPNVRLEVEHAK